MTRQVTQINMTAQGATKSTYDKVLKRFSDDGILPALYALASSVAKQGSLTLPNKWSAVELSRSSAAPTR
jgi:hypothetical protein